MTQALLLRDGAVQRAEGYRFDPAGNLTIDSVLGQNETWTFASAGQQLLNARGCSFAYDAAGNQTLAGCQDRMVTYTYDALDRLIGVTIVGVGTMTYAYDALGQRIARRFSGVTTRFVWRGGHVLFETDSAGAITRSYTWGIGDDDLVAITNHQDANKRYYVVQDLLRSVRGLVERTGTSGTWRVAWRYTPYGESFTTDGSVNFTMRFRWAGAMLDEETGLYFLRTRSYDPRFGRFIQADVAGFAGGGNLYAYAGGDPTSRRDPDGMMSVPEPQYHGDRMDWSMSGGGGNDPFAIFEWAENLGREIFDAAAALAWSYNDREFEASYSSHQQKFCSESSPAKCADASISALNRGQYSLFYYSRLFAREGTYSIGGQEWYLSRASLVLNLEQNFVIDLVGAHAGRVENGARVLAEVYRYRNGSLAFVWDQITTRSAREVANVLVHENIHLNGWGRTWHPEICRVAREATRFAMGGVCSGR